MRRVVVTGMGIVSCLGQELDAVSAALKESRSGIAFVPEYAELGFRSHLAGKPALDPSELIDRKLFRFMGDAAAYSYLSMRDAIAHAGLEEKDVSNERTGLIAGSGGGSSRYQVETADIVRNRGVRKVGPYMVTRTMTSTVSACLATPFHIKGVNYSIGSACATSAHCIGNAMEQIQLGKQDMVFAGGGEELDWSMTAMFDAMGALSKRNDDPEHASRAYDRDRDGFVIAAGGGMLVLEELEHAKARGANILAEIVGYGATSDGYDMVAPSGEGAARCMRMAMQGLDGIDYINTHGTSTPAGDVAELGAIRDVFGDNAPPFSSTKSLSGHSLGAAGVQEAIYSLLMLRDGFLAASANIENLDPAAEGMPVLRKTEERKVKRVMSNSFGFGGTNASLVFERYEG